MRKIKNIVGILIIGVLLFVSSTAYGNQNLNSTVDYPLINVKVKDACQNKICGQGYKIDGVSYVPIRLVMESMGAGVLWDNDTQTVEITKSQKQELKHSNQFTIVEINNLIISIDNELRLLANLDQQISIAYKLYQSTNESQWIIPITQGKLVERKQAIQKLKDNIVEFQKQHGDDSPLIKTILEQMIAISSIIDFEELSIRSLETYAKSSRSEDLKNFLLYRKFALESQEEAIKELTDLKIEVEFFFKQEGDS